MADAKTYRFTVTGSGRFPFDMLRYDRCWPAQGREIALLDPRTAPPSRRSVNMEGLRLPTTARWASFGWEATT